jgi:predicted nucleic-acid-binding Zn-ribbon protein
MKCLDCGKGYYVEKEMKLGWERDANGNLVFTGKKVLMEICNNCGADFS